MLDICANSLRGGLLTPSGYGGIAILRIAGRGSLDLIGNIFVPYQSISIQDMLNDHIYLGEIREADQVIDQVMLVLDRQNSVFEVHCHGGPRIVQRLLILFESLGVDVISWHNADPEPSILAEVEFFLSFCKSEIAVKAISCQASSGLSSWCKQTIEILATGNADISGLLSQINQIAFTWNTAQLLLYPPKIFIIGPPNAGKSALANALTGRSQSLVSSIPGTTRDWTSELTEMAGIAVELVDTAGKRVTDDHFESVSLQRLTVQVSHAKLFILLIPADYPSNVERLYDEQVDGLPDDAKVITVISKSDLSESHKYSGLADLAVSAVEGTGLIPLMKLVAERLGFGDEFDCRKPLIFTQRQYELVNKMTNISSLESLQTLLYEIKG